MRYSPKTYSLVIQLFRYITVIAHEENPPLFLKKFNKKLNSIYRHTTWAVDVIHENKWLIFSLTLKWKLYWCQNTRPWLHAIDAHNRENKAKTLNAANAWRQYFNQLFVDITYGIITCHVATEVRKVLIASDHVSQGTVKSPETASTGNLFKIIVVFKLSLFFVIN